MGVYLHSKYTFILLRILFDYRHNIYVMNIKNEEIKRQIVSVRPLLLTKAEAVLRNISKADDVVQDVMLVMWEKRHLLEKVDDIEAYSTRILLRKLSEMQDKNRNTVAVNTYVMGETVPDEMAADDDVADICYKKVVENLADNDALMMDLRYKSGLNNTEIAKMLNITETAVRKKMGIIHQKAAKIVKKIMKEYE